MAFPVPPIFLGQTGPPMTSQLSQVLRQSTLPTADTMHSVANVSEVEDFRSARGQVECFEIIDFKLYFD